MGDRRTVVSIDGGGVIADVPLLTQDGVYPAKFRVHVDDNPKHDLTMWVQAGEMHVSAQYGMVCVNRGVEHVSLRSATHIPC